MWFGAVVKPGGGNLVLAGAEGPTGVTFEGPIPKPSNNFAQPDTLCGNLQIETRNCGRIFTQHITRLYVTEVRK
jgi:hypothetical protein